MGSKLYKTIGLSYRTWGLLDRLRDDPLVIEQLGPSPSISDIMEFLFRHGSANIERLKSQEKVIA